MKPTCSAFGVTTVTFALFFTTHLLSGAESKSIPLDQLGAAATKQVEGDGLSITASGGGAVLRCTFQRLEGQATPAGLWLRSTTEENTNERFRLVATKVGRAVPCPLPPGALGETRPTL